MRFYEDNREMHQLWQVEEELVEDLLSQMSKVSDNQYVVRMDEQTVTKWEVVLSIVQSEGESLSFRRERILNRLTNKPPFNIRFITDKINLLFGNGSYTVFFDQNSLTLVLEGTPDSPERLKEIYITVMAIKPSNINYLYHAKDQQDLGSILYSYGYNATQTSSLLLSPEGGV